MANLGIKRGRGLKKIVGHNLDNSIMLNFCVCSLLVVFMIFFISGLHSVQVSACQVF